MPLFWAAKRAGRGGAALASFRVVSHLARLAVTLLVSTLAACGGKSSASPGEGGDGGTGAGGSGSGGQAHAGSSNGGASVCMAFDDDYGTNVNVAMVNATTAPIYLGQDMVNCGVSPLFQVNDARGGSLPNLGCVAHRAGCCARTAS